MMWSFKRLNILTIDINFFSKHFHKPVNLPEAFTNKAHKNTTLVIWGNSLPHTFENNWYNSYTYDSLSRLIRYVYTGCIACNNQSFDYNVTYDSEGRVIGLLNWTSSEDSYKLRYTSTGEVMAIDIYSPQKLESTIAVIR